VTGKKNALCDKCGMPLDTFVRLSPFVLPEGARPAKIVKASVNTNEPVQVGARTNARLYLTNLLGEPILATDLREVHTQRIHLLIVDKSLSDYHHEHPNQTGKPGQYDFSFTPQKPGPYGRMCSLISLVSKNTRPPRSRPPLPASDWRAPRKNLQRPPTAFTID
jgi:hypothetical protein